MTKYLLDTNIVLRFCNPADTQHRLATSAVTQLLAQGDECFLTAQVLIELWVVATRPAEVNGLGWTTAQTRQSIDELLQRFPLLEDVAEILPTWLNLVTENHIKGKRTHDVRLVSVMLVSGIDHLLTLNPKDFKGIPGITIVHPSEVVRDQD